MNNVDQAALARVFFALSPDERCRSRLSALADDFAVRLGGRATSKETLHLTLAFVGELRQDRLPDLMAAASDVAQAASGAPAAGVVVLDRLRYWPSGKMLWATCDHCPPGLGALADELAGCLRARGCVLELRPFAVHVTLLRRLVAAPQTADLDALLHAPVRWSYRDFVLLRSFPGVAGAAYERLGRWVLRGSQQAAAGGPVPRFN